MHLDSITERQYRAILILMKKRQHYDSHVEEYKNLTESIIKSPGEYLFNSVGVTDAGKKVIPESLWGLNSRQMKIHFSEFGNTAQAATAKIVQIDTWISLIIWDKANVDQVILEVLSN